MRRRGRHRRWCHEFWALENKYLERKVLFGILNYEFGGFRGSVLCDRITRTSVSDVGFVILGEAGRKNEERKKRIED